MHVTNSDSDRDRLERARRSVDLVSGAHEVLEVHRGIHDRRLRLAAANAGAGVNEEEGLQAKVERLEAELTALRERFDAIEQAGRYDAMTGTYKREAFVDALRTEWHVHGSNKQSLAVLFLDVDNFKKVNDDYDHRAGDAVLAAIGAQAIRCLRRTGEIAARYAGDEFVVLLPHTNLLEACQAAERLRQSIHAIKVPIGADTISPSVSIGVSCAYPHLSPGGCETVMLEADRAANQAKRGGKNRCFAHRIEDGESSFAEVVTSIAARAHSRGRE
jgi:diguanylate cyclase (GGDEF)-like protein